MAALRLMGHLAPPGNPSTNHTNSLRFLKRLKRTTPGRERHTSVDNLGACTHTAVLDRVVEPFRLSLHV